MGKKFIFDMPSELAEAIELERIKLGHKSTAETVRMLLRAGLSVGEAIGRADSQVAKQVWVSAHMDSAILGDLPFKPSDSAKLTIKVPSWPPRAAPGSRLKKLKPR